MEGGENVEHIANVEQTNKPKDRQTKIDRHIDTHTQKHTGTERERETQTQKHTHTHTKLNLLNLLNRLV